MNYEPGHSQGLLPWRHGELTIALLLSRRNIANLQAGCGEEKKWCGEEKRWCEEEKKWFGEEKKWCGEEKKWCGEEKKWPP